MKSISYIFLIILVFAGCKKDEIIQSGTIAGKIKAFDQYGTSLPDQPGIQVTLSSSSTVLDTRLADDRALYAFENIPYGVYTVDGKKDKFIQTWPDRISSGFDNIVQHAGGGSPSYKDIWLFEIPTYTLQLDSVKTTSEEIDVFLKINNETTAPANSRWLPVKLFFSDQPGVNKDNYVAAGNGSIVTFGDPLHSRTLIWDPLDQSIYQLKNGLIYVRIYPIALYQGYNVHEYYPEALGPASNVISFLWTEKK